jgi:hypothetical protein
MGKSKTNAEVVEEVVGKDPVINAMKEICEGVRRGCLKDHANLIVGKTSSLIFLNNKIGVMSVVDFSEAGKTVDVKFLFGSQKDKVKKLRCDPNQLFDVTDIESAGIMALSLKDNIME